VAPGTVLPAPAPIALAVQLAGSSFSTAVALLGRPALAPAAVVELARGAAVETALSELRERTGARSAAAVVTDGKSARALVV
jgi:hypothetical protein